MKVYSTFTNFTKRVLLLIVWGAILSATGLSARGEMDRGEQDKAITGSETKTVTDHAGHTVEIPKEPQRVASLHTRSTTVMLTELGVPLIGSATVQHASGRPYIRAAEELFGLVLQDTDLVNYGKKGADLERIKESNPDLIVGTVGYHGKVYEKLANIAPTILVDHTRRDQIQVYSDLADWLGKGQVFSQKYQSYQKRLSQVKKSLTQSSSNSPGSQTIVLALPDVGRAQFSVYSVYGGVTTVAYDLGFALLPYVEKTLKGVARERLSAEVISELNADYFLTAYSSADDESIQDVYSSLDEVAPGWQKILKSYEEGKFIVFNSETTRPPVFKAYENALDVFATALEQ